MTRFGSSAFQLRSQLQQYNKLKKFTQTYQHPQILTSISSPS